MKRRGGGYFMTLVLGIILGVLASFYLPPWIDSFLPGTFEPRASLEGTVTMKKKEGTRLLLKIAGSEGVALATFTSRVEEIEMLVSEGDRVSLRVDTYQPFLDDPVLERVIPAPMPAEAMPPPTRPPEVPPPDEWVPFLGAFSETAGGYRLTDEERKGVLEAKPEDVRVEGRALHLRRGAEVDCIRLESVETALRPPEPGAGDALCAGGQTYCLGEVMFCTSNAGCGRGDRVLGPCLRPAGEPNEQR